MCGRWRCMNIGLAQHDIINNSWAASGPSGWMDDEWTWFVIVRAAGYWWCWVLGAGCWVVLVEATRREEERRIIERYCTVNPR